MSTAVSAQISGNGFYRVRNYGTGNYIWVCDNTGSVNYSTTSADMGAMQLWNGLDGAISEPASVLYLSNVSGNYWDVTANNTGVYKIIQHYVEIASTGTKDGLTFYQVSASESGFTLYLSDVGSWGGDYNNLGTSGTGTTRRWIVEPVDASTKCYFGISPTIKAGDKYYEPFYVDFAFSFMSSGMKAYYISKIDGSIAVLKEIETDVIPANTPVIIECSSLDKSNNRLNLLAGSYSAISNNKLKGVYFCNEFRAKSKDAITPFNSSSMRVWGVNSDGKLTLNSATSYLHINWWGDDGKRYLNANQSYLPVTSNTATQMTLMTEDDYTSAIESVEDDTDDTVKDIYNINGIKVSKPSKGIYIINGKKTFLK